MGEKVDNICYIFGGYLPEFNSNLVKQINNNDFVICADNGLKSAENNKIKPNLIIGDFDSYEGTVPSNANVIVLPVEKDDTDLHFAAKEGIDRGYRKFVLSGVTGGRLDMTMATVSTLYYLFKNSDMVQVLDKTSSMYITDTEITLNKPEKACYLSVFPINGRAEGVTILGAKYNAENLTLNPEFPLGVSNSFNDDTVNISVKNGTLLIIVFFED